ncbi:hypothetical protein [Zobellia nedashkovskayae]|uniref:hypothetical protein n=1 Tax=Zobellia nedashkovskayae TaxID=2779510 RepID=UPI00188CA5E2|nr:hypothetical protein [Zobellia nedashkovskayae]
MKENNGINKTSKLSKSLGKTLIQSDLSKVTGAVLETLIEEEFIDNEIVKSIPIINILFGVRKTCKSVNDILFSQKLISFLTELSKIDSNRRQEIIERIDSEPKYNQKVGNKLLHIINNSQDYLTSKDIGKLFASFLEGKLNYPEFCKASLILNRVDYYDLQDFLQIPDEAYGQNGTEGLGLEENDNFFIIAGLCSYEANVPEVYKTQINKYEEVYEVKEGEAKIHRTLIGSKIYKILNN